METGDCPLKVVTFNVNGLRSIRDYYLQSKLTPCASFSDFLNSFAADIVCIQEHKVNTAQKLPVDASHPAGYAAFYAFPRIPRKIGHAGVATFVRNESPWLPVAWYDGLLPRESRMSASPLLTSRYSDAELRDLDSEGRVIITDHFHFLLLNIYFPNDSGPDRHWFRSNFYYAVQLRCLDLVREHGKSLVLVGDINTTYHPLDHCDYAQLFLNTGLLTRRDFDIGEELKVAQAADATWPLVLRDFYASPMRKWLASWIFNGVCTIGESEHDTLVLAAENENERWTDCFRAKNPFASCHEQYTCWSTLVGARGTNHGTRLDTIFVTGALFDSSVGFATLQNSSILATVMGSDHCPVVAEFSFLAAFLAINNDECIRLQLKQGNIPRSFGRVDQFFAKKGTAALEPADEGEDGNELMKGSGSPGKPETKKVRTAPKCTILDYFGKAKKEEKGKERDGGAKAEEEGTISNELQASIEAIPRNQELAALFDSSRRRAAPLCSEHGEPCTLLRVNKAGRNQGRQFWICSRPIGVAGDAQARCQHFEWYNKERLKQSSQ